MFKDKVTQSCAQYIYRILPYIDALIASWIIENFAVNWWNVFAPDWLLDSRLY